MTSEANPQRFRLKNSVERELYPDGAHLPEGEVHAFRADEKRAVVGDMGETFAAPGDWVVTTAKGNQMAVPDEVFRRMYEPVQDGGKD